MISVKRGKHFLQNVVSATNRKHFVFSVALVVLFSCSSLSTGVLAQSNPNEGPILFRDDTPEERQSREARKRNLLGQRLNPVSKDLKISGGSASYEPGKVLLKGGAIASSSNFQIQSDDASIDIEKEEGTFSGDVVLAHPEFSLSCKEAYLNVPYETGVFKDTKFRLEQSEFNIASQTAVKFSEFEYKFFDTSLSTCDTSLDPLPWSVKSNELDVTVDGYAHSYWTSLYFYDVPIFYTPYFGFPVKSERSSGLIIPEIGGNSQSGITARVPFFLALDESSDATIAPFIASNTRYGADFEVRKYFSLNNFLTSQFVLSDESLRGNALRGLVPGPNGTLPFDQRRFGAFVNHTWSTDKNSTLPLNYLADIHYVSDDLILRELPNDNIGLRNATFTTSRVGVSTGISDFGSVELRSEYNQIIDGNTIGTDDTVLHRAPELVSQVYQSFLPFGYNDYGLKLNTGAVLSATQFMRKEGVDGTRVNLNPQVTVPFHYENYFDGNLGVSVYDTYYSLQDLTPVNQNDADDSPNRRTFVAGGQISTAFEGIYEVDPNGLLASIASLGVNNFSQELKRVKHTIQPYLRYTYAPNVAQDSLPLFDVVDRVRNRSLVTYGLKTGLLGRLNSRSSYSSPIEELAPSLNDLPLLGFADTASVFRGALGSQAGTSPLFGSNSTLSNLFNFEIFQSYDYIEANKKQDPLRDSFSDIGTFMSVIPNSNLGFSLQSFYSPWRSEVTSALSSVGLRDDRGDTISLGYSFVNPLVLSGTEAIPGRDISNVQGQAEIILTSQLRVGYFARYDSEAKKFIDQIGALRFANECNCWHLDVGFSDRTNPDQQQFNIRFTFAGIGDITQGFMYGAQQNQALQ
jgi:lipopolysaccharide assembly outer membrane protein LptD (OstA)